MYTDVHNEIIQVNIFFEFPIAANYYLHLHIFIIIIIKSMDFL